MHLFYQYAGNNPALYLERGAANPAAVAKALKADISHHLKEHSLPGLTWPQSRIDGTAASTFITYGIAGRDSWINPNMPNPEKSKRKRVVILYWPHIVRHCLRIMMLSPAVPLLLWLFNDVLARRSLLLKELLQRKLPWEYSKLLNSDKLNLPEPLSPVEDALLEFYLTLASHDSSTIYALKRSYEETFKILSTENSVKQISRDFDLDRNLISTLYIDRIPDMNSHLPNQVVYDALAHPSFGPTQIHTPLRELMVAWHARFPHDHEHYDEALNNIGVLYNPEDKILVINMHRFFPYRRKLSNVLETTLPPELRGNSVTLENQCVVLVRMLEEQYPSLSASGIGAYRNIYFGEGTSWNYDEWDQTLFIQVDALKKMVDNARASELGRMGLTIPKRVLKARASHMVRSRRPAGFVESYLDPMTGETLKFYLVVVGRQIYFHPPWDVPEEEKYRMIRSYKSSGPARALKESVKYIETLDMWFYSFPFLIGQKGAPVGAVSGLRDWLATWSAMERSAFRRLAKTKISIYKKAEFRANRVGLCGVRFTQEEDQAIIQNYRPLMTFDMERSIFETCSGRTPHAISNRARFLCDELLESGVYDLNSLPHKRYNHNLIQRIKDAAIKNGDNPEKVMQDVVEARQKHIYSDRRTSRTGSSQGNPSADRAED